MRPLRPLEIIVLGFFMCLFGCIAPYLMIMQFVPSSFWLSFLSFASSVGGVYLGLIGAATYIRGRKD